MTKFYRICTIALLLTMFTQSSVKAQELNLEEWCRKFAQQENGGKHLEHQFFLLFGVLEEEFPETPLEKIVTTTYIIWVDNFKAQGFSNSYYDFIRTFTKQTEKVEGKKDFDTVFKTYCTALLAAQYIPE